MQNRTPRIPQQPAPNHRADTDAELTVELTAVVTGARRRALRDGDQQIDTAHLLHSLIESDAEVRTAFDGGPQLARVLGYLVQRSIGYGLRWQGAIEDSGTIPVVSGAPDTAVEGWSPAAASAMEEAHRRARLRGRDRAGGLDLLAALAADPRCRAVEVLERAGVDAALLADRIVEASDQG
ncbi:Clp protease N-terminal domain-containing protein [Streptomyces sp. NPDC059818]|uniref:Clp protease N-terminal domain-containing protein n=1 Tax=Streptomyces sp. NPDC059818 TaxID=3346962 RepID=UPI00365B37A6